MNRWEESKARSNYHFDPFREGDDTNYARTICNIYQDWSTELEYVKAHEKDEYWASPEELKQYKSLAKMGEDWQISNDLINYKLYLVDGKTPILNSLADTLGIVDGETLIQSQYFGQVTHLHMDSKKLYYYRDTLMESHTQHEFGRVFVMLEDWNYGQIINLGNRCLNPWRAGDVIWFDFFNLPHVTANTGPYPRHMAKITGKVTDRFRSLIK